MFSEKNAYYLYSADVNNLHMVIIHIGIICVGQDSAQEVADKLSFAGVRGIWNFAPTDIEVPQHVALQVVQLSDSLHALAYHMNDLKK